MWHKRIMGKWKYCPNEWMNLDWGLGGDRPFSPPPTLWWWQSDGISLSRRRSVLLNAPIIPISRRPSIAANFPNNWFNSKANCLLAPPIVQYGRKARVLEEVRENKMASGAIEKKKMNRLEGKWVNGVYKGGKGRDWEEETGPVGPKKAQIARMNGAN